MKLKLLTIDVFIIITKCTLKYNNLKSDVQYFFYIITIESLNVI